MAASKIDVVGGMTFVRNTSYKLPKGCESSDQALRAFHPVRCNSLAAENTGLWRVSGDDSSSHHADRCRMRLKDQG
jgi:hypothetical protein